MVDFDFSTSEFIDPYESTDYVRELNKYEKEITTMIPITPEVYETICKKYKEITLKKIILFPPLLFYKGIEYIFKRQADGLIKFFNEALELEKTDPGELFSRLQRIVDIAPYCDPEFLENTHYPKYMEWIKSRGIELPKRHPEAQIACPKCFTKSLSTVHREKTPLKKEGKTFLENN